MVLLGTVSPAATNQDKDICLFPPGDFLDSSPPEFKAKGIQKEQRRCSWVDLLQDILDTEIEIVSVEVDTAKARVVLPEIPLELSVRAAVFFHEKEASELGMLNGQQRRSFNQAAIFLLVVPWTGEPIYVVARERLFCSIDECRQVPFQKLQLLQGPRMSRGVSHQLQDSKARTRPERHLHIVIGFIPVMPKARATGGLTG
ncbi:hypothetical protein K649_02555 [Meiothermus ruber DSM 1279]|uniref:Uncharacterized protein n=1 Tax=Meiothermus ruber (strain ATCC 35948 / DSM 1279 / VKM B-1258 / 21) TaxID=504728 RepID=M9XAY1_MEIRD|nr:hypothetical protein K649_02555 [Meiothermus ruber DSM 1279]